ncbi:hypothetical protein [Sphingobacterium hotanense]|uniref:hypothetical protein n=1 Tax=Sphingobacterium hotanense TaxID=649196 RepID=UPI0021A69B94|nr:hypothetical protein [Sphingobacterium hotanense]MCT1526332.1 hypothetical protein [Sphingobacterium hotanense]
MLIKTRRIDSNVLPAEGLEESLSLWPFLNHLQKTLAEQDEGMLVPKIASELLLEKIKQSGDITEDNIASYKELLESLYHLAKGVSKKKNQQWALGFPVPDKVFFGTQAFYDLIDTDFQRVESTKSNSFLDVEFVNKQLYLLILERFYGIPAIHSRLRYVKRTGKFNRYYELEIDYSYVEIQPKSELPKLNLTSIKNKDSLSYKDIEPILRGFDISQFSFTGFTICSFVDCHEAHVTEQLQGLINNISIYTGVDGLNLLNDILANIVNFEGVKSSFYPILKLNGIPVLSSDMAKDSMLLGDSVFYDKEIIQGGLMKYLDNPYILSFGVEEGVESRASELKRSLQKTGLTSYICFPLIHNQGLVGIFELYTKDEARLNRNMLIQVRSFYALLAQLAYDIVLSFKSELNNVILHKYSSLQSAVEWKFNQVAAEYLGEVIHLSPEPELEKIVFNRVYPFYAAVDVKDSSLLRNKSYREDILKRVNFVASLIDRMKDRGVLSVDKTFVDRFDEVNKWATGPNLEHYLLDILSFFQEDVPAFLDKLEKAEPSIKASLAQWRSKLQYSYEDMNSSNESFERSLQKINQVVKAEMNLFNAQVQEIFPSYFETFRTDGVEYDLYVGQSISPRNTFKMGMLNQIRKEQIISIVKIGQATHQLKSSLSIPLETTQLIFIHPNPIDISFREDERRFDVEGSYNIRYQIIKKRIDKALILDTDERLVQPGHIAVVYSSSQIARDLRVCLQEVAQMGLIEPKIEEVQLENLQGVSDLKAMRVKIVLK